jgi:hypothetical protein
MEGHRLPINRDEVKATYLATGCLTEAARLHGVRPGTVRQWASRYKWPTPTNLVRQIEESNATLKTIAKARGMDVTPVSHEVLQRSVESNREAFHSSLAIGLTKAASCLTELDNVSALEASRRMVDLATAGKTIFGIGAEHDKPTLSLNVLQLGADAFLPS